MQEGRQAGRQEGRKEGCDLRERGSHHGTIIMAPHEASSSNDDDGNYEGMDEEQLTNDVEDGTTRGAFFDSLPICEINPLHQQL